MKVYSVTDIDGTTKTRTTNESASVEEEFGLVLKDALSSEVNLDSIFADAAKKYGVDEKLLKSVAKAESEFTNDCTSYCGAMGIMQLMPETAKAMGVEDAYNPAQNIDGGAKLLSILLEKYDGNVSYALAAYNAGSGNVDKYGGIPPFEETRNYVTKVIGFYEGDEIVIPKDKQQVESQVRRSGISELKEEALTREERMEKLKELFTYEDYLNFLKLFVELMETKAVLSDSDKEKDEEENKNVLFGNAENRSLSANIVVGENTSDSYVAFKAMSGIARPIIK